MTEISEFEYIYFSAYLCVEVTKKPKQKGVKRYKTAHLMILILRFDEVEENEQIKEEVVRSENELFRLNY